MLVRDKISRKAFALRYFSHICYICRPQYRMRAQTRLCSLIRYSERTLDLAIFYQCSRERILY